MILDAYGQPLRRRELTREVAAATTTGVRRPHAGDPSRSLDPRRLAAILREAEDGEPTAYFELAERMEEKDLHYLGVLGTRKRSVCQLEITVDAASDDPDAVADADLVRAWLDRDTLDEELFDILDAIGKGISVTEILWRHADGLWLPGALEHRDPRWFALDPDDLTTLRLREAGAEDRPLPAFKFVRHLARAKSGLPVRGGLARAVAWGYMFKTFGVRDWAIFLEAYGQPLRLGKYGPEASEDDKETLLRAVANIGVDAAAIIPESMVVDFVEAKVSGTHEVYRRYAEWWDLQISKAVLGQTTTTDAVSGGHAVSQEHRQVQEDIERADAKALAATLNRDLVRPIIDLNRGPRSAYPRIRIGRPEQGLPIGELTTALQVLIPMGLRVGMSDVRDRLGLPDPDRDQDVLAPAAPPAPADGSPSLPDRTPNPQPTARQAREDPPEPTGTDPDALEDELDALVEDALDDWEPMMRPVADSLRAAIADSTDPAALEERLGALAAELPSDRVAAMLDRLTFIGRVLGRHG